MTKQHGLFEADLMAQAAEILAQARARTMRLATAESCTGGLVAALLTAVAGSSDVFERGFVTYSNEAKISLLGIDAALIARHGAVSQATAIAMAEGALRQSNASISISITGIAGPGGGSLEKPVGLVHFASAKRGAATQHIEQRFGDLGRETVRLAAVTSALALLRRQLKLVPAEF